MKRTFVMSDIHGMGMLFHKMLEKIQFGPDDTLYVLGDVLDRGPTPVSTLRYIMQQPNIVFIKGNHDDMFVERFGSIWYHYDFDSTKAEFDCLTKAEQKEVLNFIEQAPLCAVVGDFILVHAGLDCGVHGYVPYGDIYAFLEAQDPKEMLWIREPFYEHKGLTGHTIIFGHSVTSMLPKGQQGKIWFAGDKIGIDCGAPFYGTLGCLCLETMEEFYVSLEECN